MTTLVRCRGVQKDWTYGRCSHRVLSILRRIGRRGSSHADHVNVTSLIDQFQTPYIQAGRTHRLKPELFDAGNIDPHTHKVAPLTSVTVIGNKGNELFHVDSSFNSRRAGHSLLLAHLLPPAGMGGATEVNY
jgi:alpha-ketoglutarate-dependent 2,4-dichlorophenoxyacetate dioxygenase